MKEKEPEIFKIINERYANLNLPYDILNKSYLIGIEQQEAAYQNIVNNLDFVNSLFEEVTYDNCLLILNIFYEVYGWAKYEKELSKKERLKYYAFLMNQWMNGITLKKIIKGSIDYKVNNNQRVYVFNQPTDEYFSASNPAHINMVIREVLSDIENVIQYNIQIYLENYLNILEYLNRTE
ncbi:hypothetical protein [Peribacillus asahii]|uniref:hypothetical protein n=1 Tax=Peribacillus asahii TaxID=228899 RepID=UPI00381481D8